MNIQRLLYPHEDKAGAEGTTVTRTVHGIIKMSAVNGKNGLRPGVGIRTPLYIIILLEKTCTFNTSFAAYFKFLQFHKHTNHKAFSLKI